MALTERAHRLVSDHFKDIKVPRRLAVDATCGNGNDTQFLAELGFEQVIAFDIQERAATITRARLMRAGLENFGLILDGHETMGRHISEEVDCFMFNLGFLPAGDRNITTYKTSTLVALTYATRLLSKTGIISLLCYPGHIQGQDETYAVQSWLATLGSNWKIREKQAEKPSRTSPILYSLTLKPGAKKKLTPKPGAKKKVVHKPGPEKKITPEPSAEKKAPKAENKVTQEASAEKKPTQAPKAEKKEPNDEKKPT